MSDTLDGAALGPRAGRTGRDAKVGTSGKSRSAIASALRGWETTVRTFFHGGGIRRRLLVWGLGLFGLALTVIVGASYYYTVRQIEGDAAELQSEIASVTAERIRNFVRRKVERFSDAADAASLYPLGS